jgi:hypothetical protein
MNIAPYPYSEGNRLEERNTYFYSEYHGQAFLLAWRASRQAALIRLPAPEAPVPPTQKPLETDGYDTAPLLSQLLTNEPTIEANRRLTERLLQRFEVSKRLYRRYDLHFKAVLESGHDELELYLLFAAVCLRYAFEPTALPLLNGLLKNIDILISIQSQLSPEQGAQLAWLIEGEANWVRSIATRVGVEIDT